MSCGFPILPLGLCLAMEPVPPIVSMRPFDILLGKKPGAIALQTICLLPSSTARWRVRWMTAAFEAVYAGTEFCPVLPIPTPAVEAVVMIRDGSSAVARACKRGANLEQGCQYEVQMMLAPATTHFWAQKKTLFTFRSITLAKCSSLCSSNGAPHVAPALANKMST